jgi:two-component system, LuxR family, sensor kinase FixL
VTIDPNQIAIVFRNLLRNARDAMPNGGTIRLMSHESAEFVVVEVADSGIGIECEDLKRITEPLYTTKARGMGLGLAISSAIINKNRARLEVESEVGVGTTFAVHLPIHPRPRVQ